MTARRWAVACFVVVTSLYVTGFVLNRLAGEPFSLVSMVVLAFFAFPLVGGFLAYRRPGNRIAWLCLAVGLAWGLEQAFWGVAIYGMAGSASVPRPDLWAAIGNPFWVPGIFIVPTFILMLFPDGSLPSPRWRWLSWLTGFDLSVVFVVTMLQPVTSGYGRPVTPIPLHPGGDFGDFMFFMFDSGIVFGLLVVCVIGSVVSLIVRFRRSAGIERKQLKWLAAAAVAAACVFLTAIFFEERYGESLPLAAGLIFVLIPVSIGMAVTRYRLYDIDRIISRTVSYGVVVALLSAVFLGVVTALSSFLPAESDLAIAGSTLAVAALFNPLRRQVQHRMDRRFNRGRYDADLLLAGFAGSLQDRVDQDRIVDDWVGVVSETMQPTTVAIWTREPR